MAAALPFIMAGLSAYSAIQQGNAQAAAANQQAATAARNQKLLEEQARTARQQAGAEEESQRREARRQLGRQSAAIGQAGIGFGGTAGLLQEDSAIQAELDALNIRYGGEKQAESLLNQSQFAGNEASILRGNAKQAQRAGLIGAGTSLLSAYGGGAFGSGTATGGINMQGQRNALLNNPAFVRNM